MSTATAQREYRGIPLKGGELALADLEHFDSRAPGRGKERRFLCPSCGNDKPRDSTHRSLAVNTETGGFTCHRCAVKGRLLEYWRCSECQGVGEVRGDRWHCLSCSTDTEGRRQTWRAVQALKVARAFGLDKPLRSPASEPKAERADEKADEWRACWEAAQPIAGTPGAEYLVGRGIPLEVATAAGVRFSRDWYGWHETMKPAPAVLFALFDEAGALVAVQGRSIDERKLNKLTAGEKRLGLFSTARAFEAPALTICEAPIDALALAAAGVPAVALCGTSWPEWLPGACYRKTVILAHDADEAGDKAAESFKAELNRPDGHTLRLRPKGAKDWAELLEKREIDALRGSLRGFSDDPLAATPADIAGRYSEPLTNDDVRITEARRLARLGRLDEAQFIARLLTSGLEWRFAVERSLRRLAEV